jgi:hypothetical protein
MFSQAWRDKPSIRLTRYETVAFSLVGLSVIVLVEVIFLSLRDIWTRRKR